MAQLLAFSLLFVSASSFTLPYPQNQRTSSNLQLPENPPISAAANAASPRVKTSLGLAGVEEAWSSYLTALEADPLLVKSITAGVILGAADLSGQAIQQAIANDDDSVSGGKSDSNSVDFARFARFAFFGFILQAPWNHFYYLLLDGALPPTDDPLTATTGIKVAIDQFVQAPIFTVLIFGFLGVLEGKTIDEIKKQLDDDYVDTMLANWKLWVPATAVNIAFCPPILRVLFLNCVFFFWSIFLSLKLNKIDPEANEV